MHVAIRGSVRTDYAACASIFNLKRFDFDCGFVPPRKFLVETKNTIAEAFPSNSKREREGFLLWITVPHREENGIVLTRKTPLSFLNGSLFCVFHLLYWPPIGVVEHRNEARKFSLSLFLRSGR